MEFQKIIYASLKQEGSISNVPPPQGLQKTNNAAKTITLTRRFGISVPPVPPPVPPPAPPPPPISSGRERKRNPVNPIIPIEEASYLDSYSGGISYYQSLPIVGSLTITGGVDTTYNNVSLNLDTLSIQGPVSNSFNNSRIRCKSLIINPGKDVAITYYTVGLESSFQNSIIEADTIVITNYITNSFNQVIINGNSLSINNTTSINNIFNNSKIQFKEITIATQTSTNNINDSIINVNCFKYSCDSDNNSINICRINTKRCPGELFSYSANSATNILTDLDLYFDEYLLNIAYGSYVLFICNIYGKKFTLNSSASTILSQGILEVLEVNITGTYDNILVNENVRAKSIVLNLTLNSGINNTNITADCIQMNLIGNVAVPLSLLEQSKIEAQELTLDIQGGYIYSDTFLVDKLNLSVINPNGLLFEGGIVNLYIEACEITLNGNLLSWFESSLIISDKLTVTGDLSGIFQFTTIKSKYILLDGRLNDRSLNNATIESCELIITEPMIQTNPVTISAEKLTLNGFAPIAEVVFYDVKEISLCFLPQIYETEGQTINNIILIFESLVDSEKLELIKIKPESKVFIPPQFNNVKTICC